MAKRETPHCASGHGLMVPVGEDFAFAPDGTVLATVEWNKPDGRMKAYVYAPNQAIARQLPQIGQGMGEQIDALIHAGRLFPVRSLYRRLTECYRIDDRRQENGPTYLVWTGRASGRGPTFQRGVVYHFQEPASSQPLRSLREVQALMRTPNVATITNTKGATGTVGDFATQHGLDLNGRVVVWDLGEIYRS